MAQVQQGATPAPPGRTPNFEDPEDVLHTINLVSQVLAVATVTPIVCFRLYVIKWKNASSFRLDDCNMDPVLAFGTQHRLTCKSILTVGIIRVLSGFSCKMMQLVSTLNKPS